MVGIKRIGHFTPPQTGQGHLKEMDIDCLGGVSPTSFVALFSC